MARRILIDAYNLMHRLPQLRQRMDHDLEGARHALIALTGRYGRQHHREVTLVFDGVGNVGHPTTPVAGVKVLFSRHGEKADPLIKRLVDRLDRPRETTVVTSDQEIVRYVRQYGCPVESAEQFARQLESGRNGSNREEKPKMSPEALEEWMTLFGQDT